MRGIQKHTIDAKNRLFVPAKYREELGNNVVITKSFTARSISVYSDKNIGSLEEKIKQLPEIEAHKEYIWFFTNSEDVEIDTQGRLMLPPDYVEHANIKKNIISIGLGDHMEIWDAEEFAESMSGVGPETVRTKLIKLGL